MEKEVFCSARANSRLRAASKGCIGCFAAWRITGWAKQPKRALLRAEQDDSGNPQQSGRRWAGDRGAVAASPPTNATAETDSDDQPPISADCLTLLDEITNRPRVLGLSEKLLAQRLGVVPPPEQLQIILLARQSGYLSPLLKGLSADERVIRAAASAALVMLDPGPDYNVLGKMLESAESFVQWQALRMLRERVSAHADQFAAARVIVAGREVARH